VALVDLMLSLRVIRINSVVVMRIFGVVINTSIAN
jgi:hypothetical protein